MSVVYVAAPYELREQAIVVMHLLEALGHVVTSTWLRADDDGGEAASRQALDDVRAADVFLALNPEEFRSLGTGGRHVELGYALAFGKQVVVLGVSSNVHHRRSDVRVIERVEDL